MPFTVRLADPRCKFSAAHFLYQHDKCSRLHGHNYAVNVELTGDLNEHFFVVDFYDVKAHLNQVIETLDHAILLPAQSAQIQILEKSEEDQAEIEVRFNHKRYIFPRSDVRLLPLQATTAELMAQYIHKLLKDKFAQYTIRVELAESEGSIAIYSDG